MKKKNAEEVEKLIKISKKLKTFEFFNQFFPQSLSLSAISISIMILWFYFTLFALLSWKSNEATFTYKKHAKKTHTKNKILES